MFLVQHCILVLILSIKTQEEFHYFLRRIIMRRRHINEMINRTEMNVNSKLAQQSSLVSISTQLRR